MSLQKEFIDLVWAEMRRQDLGYTELGKRLGESHQFVREFLNGRNEAGTHVMERILRALGKVPRLTLEDGPSALPPCDYCGSVILDEVGTCESCDFSPFSFAEDAFPDVVRDCGAFQASKNRDGDYFVTVRRGGRTATVRANELLSHEPSERRGALSRLNEVVCHLGEPNGQSDADDSENRRIESEG